jgi:DGQHR domain-containing protein
MIIKALCYKQKDKDIYIFTADANYIRKLVNIKDISISDDYFQRPFDERRVAEIKQYVLGNDKLYKKGKNIFAKGYVPNAIVLNLASKYKIKMKDNFAEITFPKLSLNKKWAKSIEVIDGQHRLLAFDDECKKSLRGKDYKMCFVAFQNLTDDEKKEIFMVLNERQKTVDKNILLRHKKLLNLLLDEEETRYEIVTRLNIERDSPLSDRIIMAGEKKKHAFKAKQIDDILNSSKALEKLIDSKGQISNNHYKVFKNYLLAWKENFPIAWGDSKNTLSKISGFRFITYLFPFVYDILKSINSGKDFQVSAFSNIIEKVKNDYFNDEFDLKKAKKFQHFQDKTSIVRLSTTIGKEIKEQITQEEEDILV